MATILNIDTLTKFRIKFGGTILFVARHICKADGSIIWKYGIGNTRIWRFKYPLNAIPL